MKTTRKQKEEIFKKSKAGKSNEDLSDEYGLALNSIKSIIYEQKRMAPQKDLLPEQAISPSPIHIKAPSFDNSGRKTMTCKQEIRLWKLMYADLAMKLWGKDFLDLENL